jgi:hypothetical protein
MNYLNKHLLELSQITCRTFATRVCYQHLYTHKLDLIKSILKEETMQSQKQIYGVDLQIGSILKMLQDGGVMLIGKKVCRFDPNDYGPWCESPVSVSDDNSSMLRFDAASVNPSDE